MRVAGNSGRKESPKIHHLRTIAQLCQAISSQLRRISTIGIKLVKQQYLLQMPHNMVNFSPLAAEIRWRVWSTPANLNGFRVLAALLLGPVVVGVSQTLRLGTRNGIAELPQRAPPIFGRAAITLGIGPHSS